MYKNNMPELKWGLKRDLPENAKYVIAKDLYENQGAKNFADMKTFDTMCEFFESNKNESYYQVILTNDKPVFMYFDIDIPGEKNEDTIYNVFVLTLEQFLESNYNIKITFVPGENCQVTSSSRKGKCSLHFIAYILFDSVIQHNKFTFNFCSHIIKNNVNDLIYYTDDNNRIFKNAVDTSVYTSFRTFRMTYMCKKGSKTILTPVYNSSTKMSDYIITYYPEHSRQDFIKITDVTLDTLDHTLSYTKPSLTSVPKKKSYNNGLPHFEKYMDFIENSAELKKVLRVDSLETEYIYENFEDDNFYTLYVKRSCRATCPFACKIHKSNNIVFQCNKVNRYLKLKCYNEECRSKCMVFEVFTEEEKYKHCVDNVRIDSLHSMYYNIPWSENYNEPSMRAYPKQQLVCIRGNMGVGKTESLKEFLKKSMKGDGRSALIITFSRSLSEKYYNDFKDLQFTNYLLEPPNKLIESNRVIVCLDSIMRVKLIKYDYVIIDEALSVFMHMNSPLMLHTNTVCNILEVLLYKCQYIYMLDACMDNVFMYNIVEYLKNKKPSIQDVYWINNSYIRETNRYVKLHHMIGYISSKKVSANPIMYDAITKIKSLLNEGKRVVVPSSTRSFTNTLTDILKEEYPDKVIITYNKNNKNKEETTLDEADEDDEQHNTLIENKNKISIDTSKWNTADVLIYSPSISAGVSYIEDHFDCLVAYIVNSTKTPSIDIVLQQLFRVRKLNEGGMFLYVMDQQPLQELPISNNEVEEYLSNRYTLSTKYTNEYNGIHFDSVCDLTSYKKELLSYQILKGIFLQYNRSRVFFVDILKNTLEQDYNIPVCIEKNNNKPTEEYDIEEEPVPEVTLPVFDIDLLISEKTYDYLTNQKILDKRDTLKVKTRNILIDFFGLKNSDINAELFDKYVAPENSYENVEIILRWHNAVTSNYNVINSKSVNYLTTLNNTKEDFNFSLYKNNNLKSINKLLTALRLMCITMENTHWKEKIKNFKTLEISSDKIEEGYQKFLTDYSEKTKKEIFSIFSMNESVKPFFGFRKIIGEGIGISAERNSQNRKRKNYNTITLKSFEFIEFLFKNYEPNLKEYYSVYC